MFFDDAAGHADGDFDAARGAQGLQLLQQGGRCVEHIAAVLQRGAGGALCFGGGGAGNGLLHGGFVAAMHHHALAGKVRAFVQAVAQLGALISLQAGQLEGARHEGAHAGGDEHGARQQLGALRRADEETATGLGLHGAYLLAEVERGGKGLDLRAQPLHQFVPGADLDGGNVVNGFVAVQLNALAAGVGQRVDDVGAQAMQAQLEHLKKPDRPCADDDGVGCLSHFRATHCASALDTGALPSQCHRGTGFARPLAASPLGEDAKRLRGDFT